MPELFIGVDLGQASDYTAISVIEKQPAPEGASYSHKNEYHLRHLERLRGEPYPSIVRRLKKLTGDLPGSYTLVVDGTGVGRAVVDMIEAAGLRMQAISIHGGQNATRDGIWHSVPKRDLIGVTQVLMQSGRLKAARTLPLSDVFTNELLNMKVKIDPRTAHDSYASWREGDHDDLVLSVAMACWYAENQIYTGFISIFAK